MSEFLTAVSALLASARTKAADGLTLAEIGQLFIEATQYLVAVAAKHLDIAGKDKKAAVLAALGQLFDQVEPAIPIPWPFSIFRGLIVSRLRAIVLLLADGAIEAIYQALKERAEA